MVKWATSLSHCAMVWNSEYPYPPIHIKCAWNFSYSNAHFKVKILKWGHPKNPFFQHFFETGKYPKARAAEGQSSTGKVNPPRVSWKIHFVSWKISTMSWNSSFHDTDFMTHSTFFMTCTNIPLSPTHWLSGDKKYIFKVQYFFMIINLQNPFLYIFCR